jgi:hypothetical protein
MHDAKFTDDCNDTHAEKGVSPYSQALQTARALGVEVPSGLLSIAAEVIE